MERRVGIDLGLVFIYQYNDRRNQRVEVQIFQKVVDM